MNMSQDDFIKNFKKHTEEIISLRNTENTKKTFSVSAVKPNEDTIKDNLIYFLTGLDTTNIHILNDNGVKMVVNPLYENINVLLVFEKLAINIRRLKRFVGQTQYFNDSIKRIVAFYLMERIEKYHEKVLGCFKKEIEEIYVYLSDFDEEFAEFSTFIVSVEVLCELEILDCIRERKERTVQKYYDRILGEIEEKVYRDTFFWMRYGELCEDFFIKQKVGDDFMFDECFWTDKYKISKNVPFFLAHNINKIFQSGLFVNIMKRFPEAKIGKKYYENIDEKMSIRNFELKNEKNFDKNLTEKRNIEESINNSNSDNKIQNKDSDKKIHNLNSQRNIGKKHNTKFDENINQNNKNYIEDFEKNYCQGLDENINDEKSILLNEKIANDGEFFNSSKSIIKIHKVIQEIFENETMNLVANEIQKIYENCFVLDESILTDIFDYLQTDIFMPVDQILHKINQFKKNQAFKFISTEARINHFILKILNTDNFNGNARKNALENLSLEINFENNLMDLFFNKKLFFEIELILRYVITLFSLHFCFITCLKINKSVFIVNIIHFIEQLRSSIYFIICDFEVTGDCIDSLVENFTKFVKKCLNKFYLTNVSVFKIISDIMDFCFEYIYTQGDDVKYNSSFLQLVRMLKIEIEKSCTDFCFLFYLDSIKQTN